jgi:hypothetical protein
LYLVEGQEQEVLINIGFRIGIVFSTVGTENLDSRLYLLKVMEAELVDRQRMNFLVSLGGR